MLKSEHENTVNTLNAIRATLAGQVMHLETLIASLPGPQGAPIGPVLCEHKSALDIREMGSPYLFRCNDCGVEFERFSAMAREARG